MKVPGIRHAIIALEVLLILVLGANLYVLEMEAFDRQDTLHQLRILHQKVLSQKHAQQRN